MDETGKSIACYRSYWSHQLGQALEWLLRQISGSYSWHKQSKRKGKISYYHYSCCYYWGVCGVWVSEDNVRSRLSPFTLLLFQRLNWGCQACKAGMFTHWAILLSPRNVGFSSQFQNVEVHDDGDEMGSIKEPLHPRWQNHEAAAVPTVVEQEGEPKP